MNRNLKPTRQQKPILGKSDLRIVDGGRRDKANKSQRIDREDLKFFLFLNFDESKAVA